MPSMTAVVKTTSGPGAAVTQVPVPEPSPTDVLVQVLATSICGTDVHIYDWNPWAAGRIHPPRVFGHEMSGRIVGVGAAVQGFKPGDFIAAETHLADRTCRQCRRGQYHICENLRILGVDRDGSFAGYISLPAETCWRNSSGLSAEVAALQEPFGNAVHAATAGPLRDRSVAVFGCGPIGLCAIAIARAEGAGSVFGVDPNPYRRSMAEQMGAARVFTSSATTVAELRRANGGHGMDVVLEMSGHPAAVEQGLEVLQPGGWMSLLGLGDAAVTLDLNELVVLKGVTLYGITGRRIWETWEQTARYLSSGRVDVGPLITHRFALTEFAEAMALIKSGRSGKVVLLPDSPG